MTIFAYGLNHKTAPITLREKFALSAEDAQHALQSLVSQFNVQEAALLSTCNRLELYCYSEDPQQIRDWFSQQHNIDHEQLDNHLYCYHGKDAVNHMFRVASGVDSMVIGEPQILGQLKSAYRQAHDTGTLGAHLERLFQYTFAITKRIRHDTCLGVHPVSIAFAAVNLAKRIFSDFTKCRVLMVGAGETIELVARYFAENNVSKMMIVNRNVDKAKDFAEQYNAELLSFHDLPEALPKADIIVSATASTLPLIGKGMVERALKVRKRRPMVMLDLAVPRDIEPEVEALDDVYLYNLDSLEAVIAENNKHREQAAHQAEAMIMQHSDHFMGVLRSLDSVNTICDYRKKVMEARDECLQNAIKHLNNGMPPEEVLEHLAHALSNRIMHQPSVQLREAGVAGDKALIAAMRQLFELK